MADKLPDPTNCTTPTAVGLGKSDKGPLVGFVGFYPLQIIADTVTRSNFYPTTSLNGLKLGHILCYTVFYGMAKAWMK
jgi:hypothetical protein